MFMFRIFSFSPHYINKIIKIYMPLICAIDPIMEINVEERNYTARKNVDEINV